jgi:hypothetical protein
VPSSPDGAFDLVYTSQALEPIRSAGAGALARLPALPRRARRHARAAVLRGGGLVYPVLDGIPCLDPRNAILASAFAETP